MINLAQSALFLQKQEAPEGKINVKNNNHNALLANLLYTRAQPGKRYFKWQIWFVYEGSLLI